MARPTTSSLLAFFVAVLFAVPIAADEKNSLRDQPDFDSQIAPLLSRRCLSCHSATEPKGGLDLSRSKKALTGGESGKSIVPGKLDQSPLWERIVADEMPPEHPLTAREKSLLKNWIVSGAKWGTDPIDPFRFTTGSRAGYDWWALQPVVRPKLPAVKKKNWIRNPIDRFVLGRLEQEKLSPSSEAGRRVLIRRLSFDLLGLPPSPEEVEAFLKDVSPKAYARLVDRLLKSTHYGERWARHWLDVIRFGESQGFERDKLRTNSWRYRDWVVQALNRDMPYDEFVQMQLAGDVLRSDDSAGIIATGFLVAGAYDEVGQSQQSAAMKAVVRQDELEDIVSVVGQTFLGMTVNCARCHDHKFDPVTQKEYYSLASALSGVRHGERDANSAILKKKSVEQAVAIQVRIERLSRQLAAIENPVRERLLTERKSKPKPEIVHPQPIAAWDFRKDLQDHVGSLHATLQGNARRDEKGLHLNGTTAFAATVPLKFPLQEKTLEAWVSLKNLAQRGGGVFSVQTLEGKVFDAIVFGEKEPKRWMAGSNGFVRTQSFNGPEETEADQQMVHLAIVYHADGGITGFRNGKPYGSEYKSSGLKTFPAKKSQVIFGIRHGAPGGNRMLNGVIARARLYDRTLSQAEISVSAGTPNDFVSEKQLLARLTPEQQAQRERLRFEISRLHDQKSRSQSMRVYAGVPKEPEPTHFLNRGNTTLKGDVVSPGGIKSLKGVASDFGLPADAPEAKRRIKLAEWVTSPDNPLFARVIVNRLWQYHFGTGLVETPSDFGFNGGRPSHPELTDWLATELKQHNWSLKRIHRLILTSATYRQDSRNRRDAAKVDANNRLLWRKSPLRLEAEAVRDTILAVSGDLNRDIGGPGYQDFTTFVRNTQFYSPIDPIGESFQRRSLYRTWIRSGRNRFLDVFDCPDPSTKTPKRAVTTTPLQALSLMNNSFVLRMSHRLAESLRERCGENIPNQIKQVYRRAFGRTPERDELEVAKKFIKQHGLPAYCRVIFNSNEFLYVD